MGVDSPYSKLLCISCEASVIMSMALGKADDLLRSKNVHQMAT